MRRAREALAVSSICVCALAAAACGSDGGGGGDDAVTVDADPGSPDARPDGWELLIGESWTIPPGEEYQCGRLTVTEDIWIKNFRSNNPIGHHHSVLTIETNPTQPDGLYPCDAGTNYPLMVYGSAPGTEDITMPDGVAVKIPAGAQLNLNLHLYNTQPGQDLEGTSEILYQRLPASEIATVTEAEVVLMGNVNFTIGEGTQTITGNCTMTGATTVFMTNPHMHRLGVHAKVTAVRAAGDVVLHDGVYDFNEQKFYEVGPVQLANGDRIQVECTYDNDTGGPVSFGDSTDQEMCFATTYRYPKLSSAFGAVCPF